MCERLRLVSTTKTQGSISDIGLEGCESVRLNLNKTRTLLNVCRHKCICMFIMKYAHTNNALIQSI